MVQVMIFEDKGKQGFIKGKAKWIASIIFIAVGLIIKAYWMFAVAFAMLFFPKIRKFFGGIFSKSKSAFKSNRTTNKEWRQAKVDHSVEKWNREKAQKKKEKYARLNQAVDRWDKKKKDKKKRRGSFYSYLK